MIDVGQPAKPDGVSDQLATWRLMLTTAGIVLLLALIAAFGRFERVAQGFQNLRLLRNLCAIPAECDQGVLGSLPVRSVPADWTESASLDACQALWASRLLAGHDPVAAQRVLAKTVDCPRQQQVAMWAGVLAWKQGQETEAFSHWTTLPPNYLIRWSYALTLAEDTDWALQLLELVTDNNGSGLELIEEGDLYAKLGHAYRTSARWPQALEAYRQAWQLSTEDPELAFFYGMSARKSGQLAEALTVLEQGLPFLALDRPYFVADYYIQLGMAYGASGQRTAAIKALDEALSWAKRQKQRAPQKEQFIQTLIAAELAAPQ